MKTFKKSILMTLVCMGLVLAACGNQTSSGSGDGDSSSQQGQAEDNSPSSNHTDDSSGKASLKELKQYSKDSDKNDSSEGDFDIVGKFVSENDSQLTMKIKGDKVAIKKKSAFDKDMNGFKGDLKEKTVVVEISTKKPEAENLKLARITRADKDGIFKKEDDGKKLVGKLVAVKKNEVKVHVKSGDKTYQKSEDFEMDKDAKKENIKDKIVQLETDEHGKVEKLKYSWVDQE